MTQHNKLKKITLEQPLFKAQSADFLLAASVTNTCTIEGITQAGIPGLIPLTPSLDAEFISTGKVFSLENIAETPTGVPTPALISRAVEVLSPFHSINILDLGLSTAPQHCTLTDFAIKASASIDKNANIDAQAIFNKGLQFAEQYSTTADYIILGESTPAGTTTAKAVACALGYKTEGLFASSFKHNPLSIKEKTIKASMLHIKNSMSCFEKLTICADNMLIFNAAFVAQISQKYPIVLAGGTQMATVLLIINSLYHELGLKFKPKNISLITTQWIAHDTESDIEGILQQLIFSISAYYSEFDFSLSNHPALALYDQGEAKEGVGAGAAIAYAYAHGISQQQITSAVEAFLIA
ncbi:MAG: nicotinate-nucleotide--dimethylbenzimidazole phosphoribosyltransferase [Pseudomonadota bacterium]